ncbi:MAG: homoserine dehydrogenase [Candidatus Hinthialibacter antarcticus]|nr:homoserine dehydrogenase [Candidatus Hinthialibacter antarcticus]
MAYRVGLIGLGTVGAGSAKTLLQNADQITKRAGTDVVLYAAADLDLTTDRGVDLSKVKTTTDGWEIINDPEVDCVVELIGGDTIAKEFVIGALNNKKDVVTANKALLATHGAELFKLAEDNQRKIYFEGAVGGGIPIIQSLYGGLASAKIDEIYAIINGTSNYILTTMEEANRPFDVVLKEAQELGYAELDPTYDVEGNDAAHKITLLASICFGTEVKLSDVYTQGIGNITVEDIEYGRKLGYCLKLLAVAKDLGGEVDVRVHPTFIPESHLLASVKGVFNAVCTYADGLGMTVEYGRGAGDKPTGHAVISDVIQCALDAQARRPVDYSNFYTPAKPLRAMSEVASEYYLRFLVKEKPGVFAKIANELAERGISILSVLQLESANAQQCPVVIMTHHAKEGDIMQALKKIDALDVVLAPPTVIRIADLNDVKA